MRHSLKVCAIALVLCGCNALSAEPAVWWPADDAAIGPQTQALDVFVMETACASGDDASGRIVGPEIETTDDEVIVTFKVRGKFSNGETCQSNPATPHRLDLGEPLGNRRLLDGGADPPREPTEDW